ncbi:hypothetical protein A0H81_07969 [Grifola frondosa]|uniref:Uncharacterized protein n=1 Tax=Grifola frondosa TaxID=5627 RepID=A0A1C7M752_GRIFR|nr:hypothetical protein A0H81_07969 [Grifola frondosa]
MHLSLPYPPAFIEVEHYVSNPIGLVHIMSLSFTTTTGSEITQDQLEKCATLYSHNYGVWGPRAKETSDKHEPGERVKINPKSLRNGYLAGNSLLATCHVGHELVGHAHGLLDHAAGGQNGLPQTRDRHQANQESETSRAYGIRDSIHPPRCMQSRRRATADIPIAEIDLDFIKTHGPSVIRTAPVTYINKATLHGTLFEGVPADPTVVSCADTKFFVDHAEPLAALAAHQAVARWPLGTLPEGYEFFVLVRVPDML